MNKKNLGKVLNMAFEEARGEGIVPSKILEEKDVNWDQSRLTLLSWETKGKITCIKSGYPINNNTYILSKYSNHYNEIKI